MGTLPKRVTISTCWHQYFKDSVFFIY